MKLKLFLLVLFLQMLSMTAFANGTYIDGLYYQWNGAGTVEVTYKNYGYNDYSGSIVIPQFVIYHDKTYTVTSIDEHAFYKSSGLTSVIIPNSVTSIGEEAFRDCINLASITIGDGVTSIGEAAFLGCSSLTSVTIPKGVTSIDYEVFEDCSGLTSITIPEGVTSIGDYAFYGCSGLNSITIPEGVTCIGNYTFYGCSGLTSAIIPEGITSIGHQAFANCSSLTSITIPESVTSIGSSPFGGCKGLTSVTINCPTVGSWFQYHSWIKEVTLGEKVTSISNGAFALCSGLTSITIPESVTSIGKRAFYDCNGLTSVMVANGNTVYDSRNGCNAIIKTASNELITGCKNTIIPEGITSIGDGAFSGCSSLTSITIPESVTCIDDAAFIGCRGLTSITIPKSVSSIGEYAFYACNGLISVAIPEGVTSISYSAFEHCSSLTSITIPKSVTSIDNCAFSSLNCLKNVYCYAEQPPSALENPFSETHVQYASLYVPTNSIEDYQKTEPWNQFGNIRPIAVEVKAKSYIREYGEDNPFFEYEATEGTNGKPTITCSATKDSPAGTYDIVVSQGTVKNPEVKLVNGTLTITKAPLKIIVGNYAKLLGEENPEFKPIYSGFKNGEKKDVLTTTPTVTTTATTLSPIGTYPVTASGASATNYEISYVDGTLTVAMELIDVKENIKFADPLVKEICVANWDQDEDGELSIDEAEAVTDIGQVFYQSKIQSFDELRFFTGLRGISYNAFYYCMNLTSITIPKNVISIGSFAFQNCMDLSSIFIPKAVTRIDYFAFHECNLTSIVVEEGNTVFDSRNGCNALISTASNVLLVGCQNTIIPKDIIYIEDRAFSNCKSLTSISIPNSVTYIGNGAFADCVSLTSITIPKSVDYISYTTFMNCTSLASIVVENGNAMFDSRNGCNAIIYKDYNALLTGCKNTVIPEDVTSIYSYAFYGCSGLTSINIPESVTSIGAYAFADCDGLTAITIPKSVTTIGEGAFQSCNNLTSATIHEGITSLSDIIFALCYNLTSISLPNSVSTIGSRAFEECNMTSIVLPSSVTYIDYAAFWHCTNLSHVYCYAEQVPRMESTAMEYVPVESATLHVPASAIDDYRNTAPWSSFGTIVALTDDETGIEQIENGQLAMDNETGTWYTLDGKKLNSKPDTKGIFIRNGKKVLVK